jgi:hypothetical protein
LFDRRDTVAGTKAGTLVAELVAAALAAVCVLTAQASHSPADPALRARSADSNPGSPGGSGGSEGGLAAPGVVPVPAGSGSGERVVYSLVARRVWLVGADERVLRTFTVVGGTVAPVPGTHRVFARRLGGTGGDGVPVEHVVLFAATDGMNVGFSAAQDGALDPPDPAKRTGAVREDRADADAMWRLATIGSTVEVVR